MTQKRDINIDLAIQKVGQYRKDSDACRNKIQLQNFVWEAD